VDAARGRLPAVDRAYGVGLAAAGQQNQSSIVFSRVPHSQDRRQIVSARPDGSHLQALTHPKKDNFDIDAQISPDGGQVVLAREVGESAVQTVLVGADGQNEQTLDLGCVDPCALDAAPTWFGTSDLIAFTPVIGPFDGPNESARSAVLQTALLDGSDMHRLSEPGIDGTFEDYYARLSLDGTYIVFTRVRNDPLAVAAFRMDVDGSDVQRLTPWGLGGDLADLSPGTSATEDLVVFETYGMGAPRGKTQNIATVPSTCASLSECRSQIHYLTHLEHGPGARFNPSWSPNGTQIAYTKFRGNRHDCCVGDIYTMRADGSHRKPVSTSPLFEYRPDWGPAPSG
jgi:Tol biopolymer transport system component